jgi:hypothetical protein
VKDITQLDNWVITAQGHFTKNTNFFPRKFINRLNGYPMKAVVTDNHWYFTTRYVYYNDSNGNVGMYIEGLEYYLLRVVLEHMKMTFDHVPTPENLCGSMFSKESFITIGNIGTLYLLISFLDSTNS